MRGRAETPEDKREIIERILAVWLSKPQQRLGQLIENARGWNPQVDLFMIEDQDLADLVEGKK
jgi:hypothetical protein